MEYMTSTLFPKFYCDERWCCGLQNWSQN